MADLAHIVVPFLTLALVLAVAWLWVERTRIKGLLGEVRVKNLALAAETESLRRMKERLREAQELAGLRTWEWEMHGPPETWADQAFRLLGFAQGDGGPREKESLRSIHPADKDAVKQEIDEALNTSGMLEVAFRSVNGQGEVRYLRARAKMRRGNGGRYPRILGTVLDVTDLKRAEEELRRLATTDGLTGTWTRRQFFELARAEFERWRRHAQETAVMMLDVDEFKELNDAFGHMFGDRVLKALVKTARLTLRRSDILGRYGGDEFAAILPHASLEAAMESANRLCDAVAGIVLPTSGNEQAARLSISVGVTVMSPGDDDVEHVLKRADKALYDAKNAGRDRVARR